MPRRAIAVIRLSLLIVAAAPIAHDFPQTIRYRLRAHGSLLARIEGTRDEKTRTVDFSCVRVGCPGGAKPQGVPDEGSE